MAPTTGDTCHDSPVHTPEFAVHHPVPEDMRLTKILTTGATDDTAIRMISKAGKVIATRIVPFLTAMVLARYLGAAVFGVYSYALSWVGILSTLSVFGLDRLVVREVAIHMISASWSENRSLLRWASSFSVGLATAIAAGAVLLCSVLGTPAGTSQSVCIAAAAIVPVLALSTVQQAVLRGLHRIGQSQLPLNIARPIGTLLLCMVLARATGNRPTATEALLAMTAATTLAVGVGSRLINSALPKTSQSAPPRGRAWLRSCATLFLLSSLTSLGGAEILILGIYERPEEVGAYSAALQCAALVSFGLNVLVGLLSPRFAALYATRNHEPLRKLVLRGQVLAVIAGIPTAVVLVTCGDSLLRYLYGPEFARAHTALTLLVAGQVVNILAGPVSALLTMTGHERAALPGLAAAAAANIVGGLWLIPRWGISGAAIANTAAVVTWNIVLTCLVRTRLGLTWPYFARARAVANRPERQLPARWERSDSHSERP